MDWKDHVCERYEAELAAIARLDRAYYFNPCPDLTERSAYAARQAELEEIRSRLYAELALGRRNALSPRRCRFLARRSRP
jgi:hypothetical protein